EYGGWIFVSGHHLLGCLQRGQPSGRVRRELQKAFRILSCQSSGRQALLYQGKQKLAEGKEHQAGGKTARSSTCQGSGKPRKSRREESDRREVWSGQECLWHEPYQGKAQ